jgi:hypothetical protein
MSRRDAPATHRNRAPILAILGRWLSGPARVLEIASGTGQHAVYFAAQLPDLSWQPSERDSGALASIESWIELEGVANVAAPIVLDACATTWPSQRVDGVFNANMIHISPWPVAEGLFAGAGRILEDAGLLFLYGPFKVAGRHTAPSNEAFDADLRRRDASWGVRDLEALEELARGVGLELVEKNDLPANNKLLVFGRSGRSC